MKEVYRNLCGALKSIARKDAIIAAIIAMFIAFYECVIMAVNLYDLDTGAPADIVLRNVCFSTIHVLTVAAICLLVATAVLLTVAIVLTVTVVTCEAIDNAMPVVKEIYDDWFKEKSTKAVKPLTNAAKPRNYVSKNGMFVSHHDDHVTDIFTKM